MITEEKFNELEKRVSFLERLERRTGLNVEAVVEKTAILMVWEDSYGIHTHDGLTIKQYAAIHLKVPRSGDPEIDAMIRESQRAEFAGQALAGISYEYFSNDINRGSAKADISQIAHCALLVADAMIAKLENEK